MEIERPKLLNFTKKKWSSKFLKGSLPHELLFDPFCRTVSRINFKPDLFHYELKAEFLPRFIGSVSPSLSWEECCHRRALELLSMNRSRYYISWSGGIDSTVMIISILQTWPAEELKKIHILLSHTSVQENPSVFDLCIARFPLVSSLGNITNRLLLHTDALMVTGELGDQLFGSDIIAPAAASLGDSVIRGNYKDLAPKIIDLWVGQEGKGRAIFEHFHPIVEECPFPVRTTHDFFWWMNFSQKWQHVKYRFVELCEWDLHAKYGEQLLHFFDTPEFQRWSLDNHDLKIRSTWQSYKFAAKEFIVAFTKNKDDLRQEKKPSIALRHFLVEKRLAVNAQLKAIESESELESYVRK